MIFNIFTRYLCLCLLAISSLAAGSNDRTPSPQQRNIEISSCADVDGICLTVGERESIKPVSRPGRRTGPVVLCVWYPYPTERGGWEDPNGAVPIKVLIPGRVYMLNCHYKNDGTNVTGYPKLLVYKPGKSIPGKAVNGWEVAKHATDLLRLQRPRTVVAPPTKQLVGIEIWFAVTSRLDYPRKSAQAGETWATVKAVFSNVTWDFGSYGRLRCTTDATKRWNTSLSGKEQNSDCTIVFTNAPENSNLHAKATVTWDIYWSSSEHTGWNYLQPYSLSSVVPLDIIELQSVIR